MSSRYRLIEAERTSFPVQFMCRMLEVFKEWLLRLERQATLQQKS